MARRRKSIDDEILKNSGAVGYSKEALNALMAGQYDQLTRRDPKYKNSQEQTQQAKSLPVLKSVSIPSSGEWESNFSKKKSGIDTDRARRKYAEKNEYKPIGRSLDKKDADTLYEFFDKNRLSSGGTSSIAHQLKTNIWADTDDWEEKYGKSIEQIVEDYAKDFDKIDERKNKEYGDEHPILATLKNIFQGGVVQPAIDLEATAFDNIAPDSTLANAVKNASDKANKQKEQIKEGVTSDMGDTGKWAYNVVTGVGEKGLRYVNPSKLKYLLTFANTAQNKRRELDERNIKGTKARLQSDLSGGVDALLDLVSLGDIPGVGGLLNSGNVWKEIGGRTLVGGAENYLTEAIDKQADRWFNDENSLYETRVRDYMAHGASEEEARRQAYIDDLKDIGTAGLSGALLNNVMGFGGKALKKAVGKVPELSAKIKEKRFTDNLSDEIQAAVKGEIPEVTQQADIDRAVSQQADAVENIQKLAEQIPVTRTQGEGATDVAKVNDIVRKASDEEMADRLAEIEKNLKPVVDEQAKIDELNRQLNENIEKFDRENKVVAESRAENPKLTAKVEPLKGDELATAKKSIEDNNNRAKLLEQEIKKLQDDPSNLHNGKLKKAVDNQIKELKKEIKALKAENTETRRKISGKQAPYAETLQKNDKATYQALFGSKNGKTASIDSNLFAAKKMAGTPEADKLKTEAMSALRKYVNTGDKAYLKEFATKVTQLDRLARESGNTYKTNDGNEYTYDEMFGENGLASAVISDSSLDKISKYWDNERAMREDENYNLVTPQENISSMDRPHQLAERLAKVAQDFDTYGYMDDIHEMDGYIEQMAEDITYGRVSDYINGLAENIEETDDPKLRAEMQGLIDELSDLQDNAPIANEISSIERELTNPNFKPITFTTEDGSTHIIHKSTRPEGKWQLSSISDIGEPSGHSVFNTDAELLKKLGDTKGKIENLKLNGETPDILKADRVTIGDMLTNPEAYTAEDFSRAIRTFDRNADTDGADLDDMVAFLSGEIENDPNLANLAIVMPKSTSAPQIPEVKEPTSETISNNESPIISEPPRTDNYEKSRVGTNTAVNSEIFTRDQIDNDPVISELNKYAKASNDKTFTQAKENVISDGTRLLDEYTTGKRAINNDLDVDQSMLLLTELTNRIKAGETGLEAQRNLLFSRLRQAGTLYGQTIQAFAKWNDTADGAIINSGKITKETTDSWKSRNKTKVVANQKIAKALEQMGTDASARDNSAKKPLTHDQIKQGVIKVIEREFGSVEDHFNDNDIEFLTTLAEDRNIPTWQITDELEHKFNTGEWYTLDESTEPTRPINQKLKNALDNLLEREPAPEKEPMTFDEIRDQVRNTLDKEAASLETEFTDEDVDYISNLIQNGATGEEIAEALNTKMATGRFGISEETQQIVNRLFDLAERYDPDSREAVEAKAEAYRRIAAETVGDASPFEKFEAWRYLAMLGNPKTWLRNFVGNTLFNATTSVSNTLAAVAEASVDKLSRKFGGNGIQRTKSVLIPSLDKGLIKGAWDDAPSHRYKQLAGSKYEKSGVKQKIAAEKSVFNSKLLKLYEKAVDKGVSDYPAIRTKYSTALAGWLKANGFDESVFDAEPRYKNLQKESSIRLLSDAERAEMDSLKQSMDALERGRDYALKQAEYATFHEDNAVADAISKFSRNLLGSKSKAARSLGYLIEGIVPFKKTPANILRSGFEYSPLGAIKSIKDTGKLIYENTGKRKNDLGDTYTKKSWWRGEEEEVNRTIASDVIESWSKTLTGTGLAMLGYYLKSKGILNSSESDEKYQNDLEGIQNYSITINGKTYTLDWAAPAVMPLLLGAEAKKINDRHAIPDEKWYGNADEIVGSINALLDPIFETSMLQGIQNVMESAANEIKYSDDGAIGGILGSMATNALTGYATQAVPTVLGQIARTVDPTRRTTDTVSDSNFLAGVEKQGRKMMNKIPGLSYFNTEYIDTYGNTQQNSPYNNWLGNLAYQSLAPWYTRNINTTPADIMARDVYNATTADEQGRGVPIRDKNVFAPWKGKVTYGGEKLDPQQLQQYRIASGQASYQIRDALAKEPWFNNLSGQKQTEILKKINSLVNKIGLEAAGYEQSGNELEAYKKSIPELLNKFKDTANNTEIKEKTGLAPTSNAVKIIKADIETGNTQAAEEKIDEATQLANLGFTKPGPVETYYKAKEALPSLTVEEYAKTYKAIDTDGNQGIKQDELIAYFNKNHFTSEAEAMKYWNMYAPKGKKLPYIKEDGTWGKH